MFAKVVLLIASYAEGEGDSGARHAMQKAQKYGHEICVMYHESQDANMIDMKLNRQLVESGTAKIIMQSNEGKNRSYMTITDIVNLRNPQLIVREEKVQDSLF